MLGTQDVIYVNTAIDKHTITLIDTPGFDDSNVGEGVILNSMASWLLDTAQMDLLLNGIIILQSVAERRVGKTEKRRIGLLKRIIGDQFMSHVVVVFTHGDPFVAEERRDRITRREKQQNWGSLSLPQSQYLDIDVRKRTNIQFPVRLLMNKPKRLLLMQTELQEFNGDTARTAAGLYLLSEFEKEMKDLSSATPVGNTTPYGNPTYSSNNTMSLQVANPGQYTSHPAPVRPDLLSNQYHNPNSGSTVPGYQFPSASTKSQPRNTHSHQFPAPVVHRPTLPESLFSSAVTNTQPKNAHSHQIPAAIAHGASVTTAAQNGSNAYDQNVLPSRPPYGAASRNTRSHQIPALKARGASVTTAAQSGFNGYDQNVRTLRAPYNAASHVQNPTSTASPFLPPLPRASIRLKTMATTATQSGINVCIKPI